VRVRVPNPKARLQEQVREVMQRYVASALQWRAGLQATLT
jgi:hypothetical protein